MSLLERASSDLKASGVVLHELGESFNSIQSHCFSIVTLAHQWQTLQSSFVSVQASLGRHIKELEKREIEVSSLLIAVENREKEVELRNKRLEFEENSLKEKRTAVEEREKEVHEVLELERAKQCRELEEREKKIEERCEALELEENRLSKTFIQLGRREKEVDDQWKVVKVKEKRFRGVEEREKQFEKAVEERNKLMDERYRAIKVEEDRVEKRCIELLNREKEVDERCKAVEVRERKVEVREKEIDDRSRVIKLEMDMVKKRCIKVHKRDKEFIECRKSVEERENKLMGRLEVAEKREKRVEERFKVVELREKQVEERCGALELKENVMSERCIELKKRQNEIDERCEAVEMREKRIEEREKQLEERFKLVEQKEKAIEEHSKAIKVEENRIEKRCAEVGRREKELREGEKKLNEWSERWDLREKSINGCVRELEGKERQMDEHCQELKECQIHEHCRTMELREKASELEENRISKMCTELERRETELNGRLQDLELKEKESYEHCQAIQLEQKRISKQILELERRKRETDSCCKAHDLKEKLLDERSKRLDFKERQINWSLRELELRERKLNDCCEAVKLRDSKSNEHRQSLEEEENRISERCSDLEREEGGIDEQCKAQDLRDKKLNELSQALDLQENQISRHDQAQELHLKEGCGAQEFKEKHIDESFQVLESKGSEINESCRTMGLKEKQLIYIDSGVDDAFRSEIPRLCVTMDGRGLQMFLNDMVDEHGFIGEEVGSALKLSRNPLGLVLDALNGFVSLRWRKCKVKNAASAVRSSCVLMLEQLMKMKLKGSRGTRRRARNIAMLWQRVMREEGESRILVLGFLLLLASYRLASQYPRKELNRLWEMVSQHRIAPLLHKELGLFKLSKESSTVPHVKCERLQSYTLGVTDTVVTSAINSSSETQSSCSNMDVNGLRSYLNLHVKEHAFFHAKVLDTLGVAPDPAKLVLNVLRNFNVKFLTPVENISGIFLLELLEKLQQQQPSLDLLSHALPFLKPPPQITHDLQSEAKTLATIWKCKLEKVGVEPLEVYCFLQFVATYKLASSFCEKELFNLFKKLYGTSIYRPEKNPYLCRALGLSKQIPGLINALIKKGRRLHAVKYICAFMLEYRYPLAPLLNEHIKFTQERATMILMQGKSSIQAEAKAAHIEMVNLQDVVHCVKEYRLESEFSLPALEIRLNELKMRIAALESANVVVELPVTEMVEEGTQDNGSMNEQERAENLLTQLRKVIMEERSLPAYLPDTQPESCSGVKRMASPSTSSPLQQSQEKRPRIGAIESPFTPYIPITPPQSRHSLSMKSPHIDQDKLPRPEHGPYLPGHLGHVRAQENLVHSSESSSTVIITEKGIIEGSSSTSLEKGRDKKYQLNQSGKEVVAEKNSFASADTGLDLHDGAKFTASPLTSVSLPQQEKHPRIEALQSPISPQVPNPVRPTMHLTAMNPLHQGLFSQPQAMPYSYRHPYPVMPNGHPHPVMANGHPHPVRPNGDPHPGRPNGDPHPVTTNGHSHPVTANGHPQPMTGNGHPQPMMPNGHPQPMMPNGHPHPMMHNGHPHPVTTTNGDPDPVRPDGHPHPVTTNGHPHPITPNGHPHSAMANEHPHLITANGHPHPVTTNGHPHPVMYNGHTCPVTHNGHPHPLTHNVHPNPVTPDGHPSWSSGPSPPADMPNPYLGLPDGLYGVAQHRSTAQYLGLLDGLYGVAQHRSTAQIDPTGISPGSVSAPACNVWGVAQNTQRYT